MRGALLSCPVIAAGREVGIDYLQTRSVQSAATAGSRSFAAVSVAGTLLMPGLAPSFQTRRRARPCTSFVPVPVDNHQISPDRSRATRRPKPLYLQGLSIW